MLLENASVVVAVATSEDSKRVNCEIGSSDKADADLIVLKGGFSTGDHAYTFEVKSDGTGKILYSDYDEDEEEFAHEANLAELKTEIENLFQSEIELRKSENLADTNAEIEAVREEITAETLEEFFWEEINPALEDPFFRSGLDDSDWGEEFHCENGTTKEFEEFLELCVLTERETSGAAAEDFLIVEAETEYESAGLDESSSYTERLNELVEIACEHFKPAGFRYDYNDGCYDRQSGYSHSSESISISVKEFTSVPAREKMLGMTRLKEKLARMNVEPERIERLTSF